MTRRDQSQRPARADAGRRRLAQTDAAPGRDPAATTPTGDALTRLELGALVDFLSALLNDPDVLGSSSLTARETSAVHRAHAKLLRQILDRR
jgi:hypothetical protein